MKMFQDDSISGFSNGTGRLTALTTPCRTNWQSVAMMAPTSQAWKAVSTLTFNVFQLQVATILPSMEKLAYDTCQIRYQ